MMWAGVSLNHKTIIVFINGNLTAARYQHEVLDTEVIPLLRKHRGMQLLHHGALAHQARSTTAYLNANNVNVVNFVNMDMYSPATADSRILRYLLCFVIYSIRFALF